jgi:hypothetical protein
MGATPCKPVDGDRDALHEPCRWLPSDVRWSIENIRICDRHRRDLGNINSLAAGIAEIDLLQSIVIEPTGELIVGRRRPTACQLRDQIGVFLGLSRGAMATGSRKLLEAASAASAILSPESAGSPAAHLRRPPRLLLRPSRAEMRTETEAEWSWTNVVLMRSLRSCHQGKCRKTCPPVRITVLPDRWTGQSPAVVPDVILLLRTRNAPGIAAGTGAVIRNARGIRCFTNCFGGH